MSRKWVRALLVLLIATLDTLPAQAGGFFGPPEPESREGSGYPLSLGYSMQLQQWEPDGGAGGAKITQNQYYLQLGTMLSEYAGGYLRLGMADFDDGKGFQDGYKLQGGLLFKGLFFGEKRKPWGFGYALLGTIAQSYESTSGGVSAEVKLPWDIGLALSLQRRLGGWGLLYGGVLGKYGQFTVDYTGAGTLRSTTFKETGNVGGVFGGRFHLGKGWLLDAEAQYTNELSAGVSFTYLFKGD